MVVAQVVRIRNNTMRTFRITSGDPFYTPCADGQPWPNGMLDVTPGLDQACDGLCVPWESTTTRGLEIQEERGDPKRDEDVVRFVVGPVDVDGETQYDWLQCRRGDWEILAQERWMPLGRRHLLGAVGGSVELQLTFRDARGEAGGGGGLGSATALPELVHFEHATKCAPPNMVFLSVFDLAPAMSIPNAVLCNTVFNTFGAFHAAVEVYGEEWSFYRTPNSLSCGVCKSLRPRHHPVHVYRQSIPLGTTKLADWEVRYLIRGQLAVLWPGGSYDLLEHNCIHFCDELLLQLGVSGVPPWVRALHETGSSVFSLTSPLSWLMSTTDRREQLEVGAEGEVCEEYEQADTTSVAASATATTITTTFGGELLRGAASGFRSHRPPAEIRSFVEPVGFGRRPLLGGDASAGR